MITRWICYVVFSSTFLGNIYSQETWSAGAGRAKITPTESIWMSGYAGRKTPADGTTTDLWAKTLVLEDAAGNKGVLISLDLVGIGRELSLKICSELKEKFGFERNQIAIFTSHTHSGPVVGKNLGAMFSILLDEVEKQKIEKYTGTLPGLISGAVGDAMDTMEKCRVQWGSGYSTFAVNRRENKPYTSVPEWRAQGKLKGPVDHDVPVLSVRNEAGKLTAVVFGYACHATTVSFNQWSGDYPGYAQIELEKAYPGVTALFWAGCGGDQNPLPRKTVELAEKYGAELARAVSATLEAPMAELTPRLEMIYQEIDLQLQKVPDENALTETEKSKNRFEVARARYLRREMEKRGNVRKDYPFPIGLWSFGDEVDFVHLGGEVVVDYALRLKRELRGEQTWVAGYANDVMAYIPSLRVLREGGYEGGGSNVYYGLPGLWDENVEEAIIEAVHQLAKKSK